MKIFASVKFRSSQIIILTNFVFISSFSRKRVDCRGLIVFGLSALKCL